MQFRLTFDEIGKMIQEKTGKELPLLYGGPHTVRVSYKVPLMGPVGIDFNVERCSGSDIFLSYSGGKAMEYMLRTAFRQVEGHPGADIIRLMDDNGILLALGENPQLAQIFDRIEIQDIHFDEQHVMIDFIPR